MGFGKEVDMIRQAHELGFFTVVYVFNPDEARAMAEAGADAIIAHMGLTVGGSIGLERVDAMRLDDAPAAVQAIGEAAWAGEPGGDPALPRRADRHARGRRRTCWRGATPSASSGPRSMERLPVETALTETTRQFKQVALRHRGA